MQNMIHQISPTLKLLHSQAKGQNLYTWEWKCMNANANAWPKHLHTFQWIPTCTIVSKRTIKSYTQSVKETRQSIKNPKTKPSDGTKMVETSHGKHSNSQVFRLVFTLNRHTKKVDTYHRLDKPLNSPT